MAATRGPIGIGEIVREGFVTARKGWDPDDVRVHLEAIADRVAGLEPEPMSDVAVAGVRKVLDAAEQAARDLTAGAEQALTEAQAEADSTLAAAQSEAEATLNGAREEAERIRFAAHAEAETTLRQATESRDYAEEVMESARSESEAILTSARSEAATIVEESERAVAGLISHAAHLGERVGRFGQELEKGLGEADDSHSMDFAASPLDAFFTEPRSRRFRRPQPEDGVEQNAEDLAGDSFAGSVPASADD